MRQSFRSAPSGALVDRTIRASLDVRTPMTCKSLDSEKIEDHESDWLEWNGRHLEMLLFSLQPIFTTIVRYGVGWLSSMSDSRRVAHKPLIFERDTPRLYLVEPLMHLLGLSMSCWWPERKWMAGRRFQVETRRKIVSPGFVATSTSTIPRPHPFPSRYAPSAWKCPLDKLRVSSAHANRPYREP